jgi:DNA-binding transcriptional regulator PaaX
MDLYHATERETNDLYVWDDKGRVRIGLQDKKIPERDNPRWDNAGRFREVCRLIYDRNGKLIRFERVS